MPSILAWPPSFFAARKCWDLSYELDQVDINLALLHHFAQSFAEIFCDWIHPCYIGFNALNSTKKKLVTINNHSPIFSGNVNFALPKKGILQIQSVHVLKFVGPFPIASITGLHLLFHPSGLTISSDQQNRVSESPQRQRFETHHV